MDISVVIPAYNEEGNVKKLRKRISEVLIKLDKEYEIIFIDDGSTDNTYSILENLSKKDKRLRVIKFRRNFGQSAAWSAGFAQAKGDVVITMDADLQNDPRDIPKLLRKLDQGYDVVSGWRHDRKDPFTKRLFSIFSRFLRQLIIKDEIHDSGCSLKAYRSEILKDIEMTGEMHRYITEVLALKGYKLGEVKVRHHPRKHGKTKYNFIRLPKGFLDLIVVAFWQRFSARPIHLFGGAGIIMSLLGFITGVFLVYQKFFEGQSIGDRPLLLLTVLFIIVGMQFVLFGLLADMLMKMYYQDRTHYSIEKIL